ncbi:hypothetical protein [Geobacter sp. SVR]|uniref:hypothetical protein n=1 Tax=Geobacter sp. SVR TaxID=2495594 RepID=UPI001564DE3A|nr:hypothetical protein [Geobacter sp. SVR]
MALKRVPISRRACGRHFMCRVTCCGTRAKGGRTNSAFEELISNHILSDYEHRYFSWILPFYPVSFIQEMSLKTGLSSSHKNMKKAADMKASELAARILAAIDEYGDLNVFYGDMKPVERDRIEVVMTSTEDPEDWEQYGDKYLHLGDF